MQIYPAIDIKDGRCVRLTQGKFDTITVFEDDPTSAALDWEEAGASYLHVVDLDGARRGSSYNNEAIQRILHVTNLPIQVGGGIRNMDDIKEKIDMGVARVILGTAAIKSVDFVREAVHVYKDKIAVSVDALNGKAAAEGWEEVSEMNALDLCKRMRKIGVKTVIFTDISRDGMLSGPNITATRNVAKIIGLNVIASGGITSLEDLDYLQKIKVSGAIIGKALYSGDLDLREVIQLYQTR